MSSITSSSSSSVVLLSLSRLKPQQTLVPINGKARFRRVGWRVIRLRSASPSQAPMEAEGWEGWLDKLPDKKKPIYSHSLPCIEAWLRSLGFYQSREDRSVWIVENPNWHAKLSLDVTELHIRYLKSGPGNLEKDVERRFSYALSRDDIENAILGGP